MTCSYVYHIMMKISLIFGKSVSTFTSRLRLSYAVFAVKGYGQYFQWAGSSDMCLLSSQNLAAIRNALWYLGSGVVGCLRLYHGTCNSAYIIIKATANKQALKLCLYLT